MSVGSRTKSGVVLPLRCSRPRRACIAQSAACLGGRFEQGLGARFFRRGDPAGRECALRLGTIRVPLRGDRRGKLLARRDVVEPPERALQIFERAEESLAAFSRPLAIEQGGAKFDAVAQLLAGDPQFMSLPRVERLQLARSLLDFLSPPREFVDGKILDRLPAPLPRRAAGLRPRPPLPPRPPLQPLRNVEKQRSETIGRSRLFGALERAFPAAGQLVAESFASRDRQPPRQPRHLGEEHIEVAGRRQFFGEPLEFRLDAGGPAVLYRLRKEG